MNFYKKKTCKKAGLKYWNLIMNYFFSGWIGNLGVVPLFLLVAFLLAPAFFLLFALLIFVILVFDTIFKLRINFKTRFVTSKIILVNLMLSPCMYFQPLRAGETDISYTYGDTIIVSQGETYNFSKSPKEKYTITNKKCLSHKESEDRRELIIKGKCTGFSEVLLWKNKNKIHTKYHVYIMTKKERFKISHIFESLKEINLQSSFLGNKVSVQGEISDRNQYQKFKALIKEFNSKIVSNVTISDKTSLSIIEDIYKYLFSNGFRDFYCRKRNDSIDCFYSKLNKFNKKTIKFIEKNFYVSLTPVNDIESDSNFRIRLHIFQLERTDGQEISLGLNQIRASLGDVFESGISTLIEKNSIVLSNNSMKLSTIAQPETIIQLGNKSTIQLGSEIPFQSITQQGVQTDWRFAGIKLSLTLKKSSGSYKMKYQIEIFKPVFGKSTTINGTRNTSQVSINPEQPINLFQVTLLTDNNQNSGIPGFMDVPIIGKLFQSNLAGSQYKMVLGTVRVEKI